jgi:hypothetical protein
MKMSLDDWLKSGWVTEHQTSKREIVDLLDLVDRDLHDCQTAGLSADWRLNIAYNAALQAATAALAARGYRAGRDSHHFRVIQSLAHTIAASRDLVAEFDHFRKKRNIGGYERAGMASNQEADEMIALARQLRDAVGTWLRENRPDLL